ncbi:THO complex subunit 6 homolog [Nilaparvata lugens]|uniref:THO complex subunit 6 homolog n=1 Tax=Nilaparvata lugens TaxID=108931 RepID=UPI00193D0B8E|nr:THO complex subunit 6 homolog [Nilaparvata lugens]
MVDRCFYNTTLSQTFSPCGNYLVAGNIYGQIAVFDLQNAVEPNEPASEHISKPLYVFQSARDKSVSSLVSNSKFLIVGTVGKVTGYDWKSIISNKNPKVAWSIQIPTYRDSLDKSDVNSLAIVENSGDQTLVAGCGDKKVHLFSLRQGKRTHSFDGHDNYVHSVYASGSQIVSSGEDGKVCMWDWRQSSRTAQLEPHTNQQLARPHLGKWIGDACFNDDWLVCGGGPYLSLWHLRSMNLMNRFANVEDSGIHVVRLCDDRILAGGTSPYFYHLSFSGEIFTQLETSSLIVYSAIFEEKPFHVTCLAGSSPHIDLCTNFKYRDQILTFEDPKS